MRDKQAILEEIHQHKLKAPKWDTTASLHERITIEVQIDIRDALTDISHSIESALVYFDNPT